MVSVVLPVIRPEKAKHAAKLAVHNAGVAPVELLMEEDRDRIGAPKMVKRLVEKSTYDLVAFIGDDTLPQPGWLRHAIDAMATLPDGWGLVGLNDKTGRTLATHWLASKKLLPLIGGEFFSTEYWHCFCDNELQERCTYLDRYVYANQAVVYHDHPLLTGRTVTEDYRKIYSAEYYGHDRAVFMNRRPMWATG